MEQNLIDAYQYARKWQGIGTSATFIPELTKEDPNQLGICITTCAGEQFKVGDWNAMFTIQSISKLLLLAVALDESGFDSVFSKVGMEPSGDRFNSVYKLELFDAHPSNPMINAGAIAVASCIKGKSVSERAEKVFRIAEKCFGVTTLDRSDAVYQCETETGHRNQALAQMMMDAHIIDGDSSGHLAVYYHACSIMANCCMLSHFGAVLANNGRLPGNSEQIMPEQTARMLRTFMASCGMYNLAGEFAIRVGVPAKSGSAGGIMAAVHEKLGLATFSPLLDSKGNSICGIKALEKISSQMNLCVY